MGRAVQSVGPSGPEDPRLGVSLGGTRGPAEGAHRVDRRHGGQGHIHARDARRGSARDVRNGEFINNKILNVVSLLFLKQ